MDAIELWDIVYPCFKNDDGSLPTVELQNLLDVEIGNIYSIIRKDTKIVTNEASFWDIESQSERQLDDVSNAALLVPNMKAEPFHFCIDGLKFKNVKTPCLGFFIFQDVIAIDYRMGDQWGPEQVFALFSWLKEIINLTKRGFFTPTVNDCPPDPDVFLEAWRKFLSL